MKKTVTICAIIFAIYACALAPWIVKAANQPEEQTTEKLYDTKYLEQWEESKVEGTVRMVGAWVYAVEEDNTYVLEDESGNLWVVRDVTLAEDARLLLWLSNNATPDYLEDDYIVTTWTEAR